MISEELQAIRERQVADWLDQGKDRWWIKILNRFGIEIHFHYLILRQAGNGRWFIAINQITDVHDLKDAMASCTPPCCVEQAMLIRFTWLRVLAVPLNRWQLCFKYAYSVASVTAVLMAVIGFCLTLKTLWSLYET